jgi:hypothetical protein
MPRSMTIWLGAFIVMLSARCHGQETIRIPVASEEVAAGPSPIIPTNYYNVQIGSAYLRFQGEMGVEQNDNVNYTETNRRADVILRPRLDTEILWPLTERNSFFFSSGLGYVEYIRTSTLDHPYVAPDSRLAVNIFAGDFVFNLHDRFSAQDNVLQTPSLSGTGNYFQIENISGADATWHPNKLMLSLTYDYDLVSVLSGPFTSFSHGSDLFSERTTFLVNASARMGLEVEGGFTDYAQNHLENNTEFAVGPFYENQITPYLRTKFSAGFVAYFFDPNSFSDLHGFDSYYVDFTLNHQVNKWFSQWLSTGRMIEGGTPNASLYVHDYVYYQANFYCLRYTRVGVHFSYDHGDTAGGFDEEFDRFGAGLYLSRNISQNLTANITYEFWRKNSDLYNYGYVQNRLILDATYKF